MTPEERAALVAALDEVGEALRTLDLAGRLDYFDTAKIESAARLFAGEAS